MSPKSPTINTQGLVQRCHSQMVSSPNCRALRSGQSSNPTGANQNDRPSGGKRTNSRAKMAAQCAVSAPTQPSGNYCSVSRPAVDPSTVQQRYVGGCPSAAALGRQFRRVGLNVHSALWSGSPHSPTHSRRGERPSYLFGARGGESPLGW